jgi:uncharacterized protein
MPETVRIDHPVMMFRISQLYRPGMSDVALYEATRGVWKVGPRREHAQYAFAVADGIVLEVFQISSWQSAGVAQYQTRKDVHFPGRWEFTGWVAPDSVRSLYVGKSVAAYLKRGAQNPVTYVHVP